MLRRNKNFITAYILLVGLPILILIGVLRSGRKLVAPLSVDGVWRLQADVPLMTTLLCMEPGTNIPEISLAISQSGKYIGFQLAGGASTGATGVIEGAAIKASALRRSESPTCDDSLLTLTAVVNPYTSPRSMEGTISSSGCPSCSSVDFHAIRQSATQAKKD